MTQSANGILLFQSHYVFLQLALGPAKGLSWSKDVFPGGGLVTVGPNSCMLHSSEMLELV